MVAGLFHSPGLDLKVLTDFLERVKSRDDGCFDLIVCKIVKVTLCDVFHRDFDRFRCSLRVHAIVRNGADRFVECLV